VCVYACINAIAQRLSGVPVLFSTGRGRTVYGMCNAPQGFEMRTILLHEGVSWPSLLTPA
ncbi:MAG: hypothetical protein QME75_14715, partial [Deltaproteobacteria bacterium]|nr:hypothetical protein [Desulfitobacteriaceae bacterium]MDI6854842.1 hypothetical protein [Deltaproteobacteria bacterium]